MSSSDKVTELESVGENVSDEEGVSKLIVNSCVMLPLKEALSEAERTSVGVPSEALRESSLDSDKLPVDVLDAEDSSERDSLAEGVCV